MPREQSQESLTASASVAASTSPQDAARAGSRPRATPKKNLPATCDICHKTIARAGDLPRHKKTHLTDKSSILHYCPLCEFSSIQRSNVTVHIRIHTGEKPLQCPDCEQGKFADPGSLTRHRKRFHGYVPVPRAPGDSSSSAGSASPGLSQPSSASSSRSPSVDREREGGRRFGSSAYKWTQQPSDFEIAPSSQPFQPRSIYTSALSSGMPSMNQSLERRRYDELSTDSDDDDERESVSASTSRHRHRQVGVSRHAVSNARARASPYPVQQQRPRMLARHSMPSMDAHLDRLDQHRQHSHDLRRHQYAASVSAPVSVSRQRVSDARSTSRE